MIKSARDRKFSGPNLRGEIQARPRRMEFDHRHVKSGTTRQLRTSAVRRREVMVIDRITLAMVSLPCSRKPVPVEKTRVFGCSTKWAEKQADARKSLARWTRNRSPRNRSTWPAWPSS